MVVLAYKERFMRPRMFRPHPRMFDGSFLFLPRKVAARHRYAYCNL